MKKIRECNESVWLTEVFWSNGWWGPFPGIPSGRTRVRCREYAEQYFSDHGMSWPYQRVGRGNRFRFRKYVRKP